MARFTIQLKVCWLLEVYVDRLNRKVYAKSKGWKLEFRRSIAASCAAFQQRRLFIN